MKPHPTVLIIDADRAVRRLVRSILESQHYKVHEAEDGPAGMGAAVARRPDVVILEICLPGMDGMAVLWQLRQWSRVPVLVLSSESAEEKKVQALDAGANDYLTKPFGSAEMLARLRVLQRSVYGESDVPIFVNGNLKVDITSHLVTLGGEKIKLTPTEEAVFYTLVRNSGKLVTCKHIIGCVWGAGFDSKIHDLHVHIRNLRRKLAGAADEVVIQTEGSLGYRLFIQPGSGQRTPRTAGRNLAA
jgi:two-component system KDP operon response regulator KdpE